MDLKAESKWGEKLYKTLSADLCAKLPDVHSFSETSLKYIKYFYSTYSQLIAFRPQLEDELKTKLFSIPWGHQRVLLDKFKDNPEKALFFVQKAQEQNWSRAVLLNFVDTDLYERQGKAISNFSTVLPAPQSDLAQEITKDPYNFNFLTLDKKYDEKDLKEALVSNVSKFLIEMGSGFAYMGREYRIVAGDTEQFMDLLFYNTFAHCYVVVDLLCCAQHKRSMTRYGSSSTANTLSFTLTGNRVTGLSGSTSSTFAYDASGNRTSDSRKGLTMSYNILNLPKSTTKSGSSLTYVYL